MNASAPDVFISHSSQDEELAGMLVDLLEAALHLRAEQIRCTSVEGHRLEGGADTDEAVRREVRDTKMLLGLLSPNSLRSTYVAFELGARWVTEKPFKPLLAPGVTPEQLEGPIASYNALRCELAGDLHQLIGELGRALGIEPDRPEAYNKHIQRIQGYTSAAQAVSNPAQQDSQARAEALKAGLLSSVRQLLTDWKTERAANHFGVEAAGPILSRFVGALSQAHAALGTEFSEEKVRPLEGVMVEVKRLKNELQYVDSSFQYDRFWSRGEELLLACERIATAL